MTWHRKIPGQAACGPCCGIKEKLQTLWDRTINSILRINQVEPDDQGNIRITSDSEALTVSEGTNEIILDLDTSQLPAAAVLSVNGETGAVQLTGDDIPSLYNGTVNSNIAGLWGNKATQADLTTEITNRQNADTALQNNINALQASIPQEAADAVAADPTVQSFAAAAADIPNKVDKRTGSGLRAYTHDGSTQDDTPVIDGTTGTTIPIRDSNGRLQAADPAAGATDKTLVTANWVSQTGDSAPNNLAHRTANETYRGTKTFTEFIVGTVRFIRHISSGTNGGKWAKVGVFNANTLFAYGRMYYRYGIVDIIMTFGGEVLYHIENVANTSKPSYAMVKEADGTTTLWTQMAQNYLQNYFAEIVPCRYGGGAADYFTPSTDSNYYDNPVVDTGAILYNGVEI